MANNNQDDHQEFNESYQAHRRDIRFVAVTNLLILALLVAVYFLNRQYGIIDAVLKKF